MNPCIPHLKWHHVPQLYQLLSEKLSIHCALLSAMFDLLHSISDQELFKKHLCNSYIPKERNGAACPSYINYCLKSEVSITLTKICCQLCSTCYTAVRIKNCLKSTSAIRIATMKNTGDFRYEGKPSCATAKLILFAVSKDEWDTKEDTEKEKSMKNALYILRYAKRHLSGQSNVEQ